MTLVRIEREGRTRPGRQDRRPPPAPVRMAKTAINGAATALHRATRFMDLDQFALAATGNDHAEAIRASIEKRAPTFRGD